MKIGPLFAVTLLPFIQACAATGDIAGGKAPPSLQTGLQSLAGFIGNRHCSGSFLKSGKDISASETVSADLSGYWLVLRHDDDPPFSFHALELWGYDAKAGRFVAEVYDNFGGYREFVSPGWDGQSLTWTNADARTPKRDRFVFEKQADGGYRYTYDVSADGGSWTSVDRLDCVMHGV